MLSFLKKKLIKHQKESLQELNLSQQYYGNTRRNTPAPDSIKKALSKINLRLVLIRIIYSNPTYKRTSSVFSSRIKGSFKYKSTHDLGIIIGHCQGCEKFQRLALEMKNSAFKIEIIKSLI